MNVLNICKHNYLPTCRSTLHSYLRRARKREPTAKIESDLCKKNEDRALAANSLFNLGNLGSYIFACFRCVTFKLGKFMNVNIKVLFLVALMDFCQMDLVC